jgi:hypothetical protein
MTLNVETTVTHIGAQPPPPAGHNTATGSPSVPKGRSPSVTANVTANGSPNVTAGAPAFAKDQLRSVGWRAEALEYEQYLVAFHELARACSTVFAGLKLSGPHRPRSSHTMMQARQMAKT